MGHPLDEPVIITSEELASLQADYPPPVPRVSRRNKGMDDQDPVYLFPYADYRPKQLQLSRRNKPGPPSRARGYVMAAVVLVAMLMGLVGGVALDRHARWLAHYMVAR